MPRVRILRATVASPGVVEPDQVHDLPADEAATLVRLQKAEYVTASGETVPAAPPASVLDEAPLAPLLDQESAPSGSRSRRRR